MKKQLGVILEIGSVVFLGFAAAVFMKINRINFFALPHLVFLLAVVFFRSVISDWKWNDYGFKTENIGRQVKLGLFIWIVTQTYQATLHAFSPLFPGTKNLGATVFKITSFEALLEKVGKIALFKAGIIESLRYFSYAQGLLMETFSPGLGAFMTLVYFGTAHMGIMNLISLPASFLFVYFYRTYKIIIPVIIFHMLGDTVGFIQIYLTYLDLYYYNLIIFILLVAFCWILRKQIKVIFTDIGIILKEDLLWLKNNKLKAITISLILPLWLHLLLFLESKYFP